jgi:putative ABC transport system ATP-binding protein
VVLAPPEAASCGTLLSVQGLRRLHLVASFDLGAGECVALRGPSGAGKTQLLRALADLDPNEGTVLLDGTPREAVPAPVWRRHVVYLAAEPGWWADTVGEHFPDWLPAAALVERLGLPADCGAWSIQRLSTGERQRLALVRALVSVPPPGPRVLLLDEPTAGLDEVAKAVAEALIAERRAATGLGVLWVTHDATQAKRIARRWLLVRDGFLEETSVPP